MSIFRLIHNNKFVFLIKKIFRKHPSVYLPPKEAYNKIAKTYNNKSFNLFHFIDVKIISTELDNFDLKDKNILDFGCGTGWKFPILNQYKFNKIYGTDISEEMLKICKTNYPEVIQLKMNSSTLVDYAENQFDFITCNLVIGYIPNLSSLFKHWRRMLKPDGIVLISDMAPNLNSNTKKRNFFTEKENIIVDSFSYSPKEVIDAAISENYNLINQKYWQFTSDDLPQVGEKIYNLFKEQNISYSVLLKIN